MKKEQTPEQEFVNRSLASYTEELLGCTDIFRRYSKGLGSLTDPKEYKEALYIDFEDYDYLHDTSELTPVYLNDFDFKLEEDRERLAMLTRMEFDGNVFESIATCDCKKLRGNYLLGSGRICKSCGTEVQLFLDRGEDTLLWIKTPEGVDKFINLGMFITFFNNISIGSPKINVPRYFIDTTYRNDRNKRTNASLLTIKEMLKDLNIKDVGLNSFIRNADAIMEWIFIGDGRRSFKPVKESLMYMDFWKENKSIAFCDYIKVPNRYSTILERTGRDIYAYPHQADTAKLYFALADVNKSNSVRSLTERELKRNEEIVGRNLFLLSEQYRATNNRNTLFSKESIIRKHVCSGAIPFTARTIISSQTGIIDNSVLTVPWKICLTMMEIHITSYLYRLGYTPQKAKEKLIDAANHIDPEIDAFFRDVEENNKCLIQGGRNPSIEYLSLITFRLKVNRDLEDESCKIPILSCAPLNADFDG